MVYTTQTLPYIKSQEFIGHIKNYFMTSPLTYVTNGIQDFGSEMLRAFAHGAMDRLIDPSLSYFLFQQYSTTGLTTAMVSVILYVGWCI